MLSDSSTGNTSTEAEIMACVMAFPSLWVSHNTSSKLLLAAESMLLPVLSGRSLLLYHLYCDFSPFSSVSLLVPPDAVSRK